MATPKTRKPKTESSATSGASASATPAAPQSVTEREAMERITLARSQMLMNFPFFGYLAMELKVELDGSIQTAATDGERVYWNPKFLAELSVEDAKFVTCHEVLHCVLQHIWRKGGRRMDLWNYVTDMVINDMLIEAGFKCTVKGIIDEKPDGKSAEVLYDEKIKNMPPPPKGGGQPGKGGPGGTTGSGLPTPLDDHSIWEKREVSDPADPRGRATADRWEARARDAARSKDAYGRLPASLRKLIDKIIAPPKKDWRDLLRDQFQTYSDYSFSPADRRFPSVQSPFILPSLHSVETHAVIAIDTSGSINDNMIAQFWAEAAAIMSNYGVKAKVLLCDAAIQKEWDEFEFDPKKAEVHGGGGTSFVPVFERVEQLQFEGWHPHVVIYLTDLAGEFPKHEPHGVRTAWVVNTKADVAKVPFGDVIVLENK